MRSFATFTRHNLKKCFALSPLVACGQSARVRTAKPCGHYKCPKSLLRSNEKPYCLVGFQTLAEKNDS